MDDEEEYLVCGWCKKDYLPPDKYDGFCSEECQCDFGRD